MKMLIDGKWVDSSNRETIPVLNPYTGELLDQVPAADKEDVDRAIDSAGKGQKKWNRLKIRERAEIFRTYLEQIGRAHV